MNRQNIKNLLNFDASGLDLTSDQGMREATETRQEIYNLLQGDHDLSVDDENKLTAKANLLSNKIENAKGQLRKGNMKGMQTLDGQPLKDAEDVNRYRASDKFSNQYPAPRDQNVSTGAAIRAIIDKPKNAAEKKIHQNSVSSSGYELPEFVAADFIDKLRAANPLLMENGAGSQVVELPGGDQKYIRIKNDPQANWHAELNEENLDSTDIFDSVTLSSNTVMSLVEVSRELMMDSNNLEQALESAFVGSLNDAILTATFTGSGANTPTGLATTITQTEEYTNGGDPDWSNFVNASKTLYDNNVPEDNRSFIHAPDVWQTLALTKDNNGRYQDAPSFIRDVPNFTTSGASTGEAYVGDFSNVVYGFRTEFLLEQYNGPSAQKFGTLWLAAIRMDLNVFRPSALVRIEEAAA